MPSQVEELPGAPDPGASTPGAQVKDSQEKTSQQDSLGAVNEKRTPKTDEEATSPSSENDDEDTTQYPQGLRLALVVLGLAMAVFLVFLDMTVISTAIPAITNQFKSLEDVGWYGSAFMLTLCAFQLVYGQAYEMFHLKTTFLVAVVFQCVGSAVCASAQSSFAFIMGRAVTGIGCSGILVGAWVVLAHSAPLRKRAMYTGFIGAFSGVGGIIGPILSGAFTDSRLTWRWSFYIALPLGALTLALIVFGFKPPQESGKQKMTLKEKLGSFDYLGLLIFFACLICLLIAMQWGGTTYAWGSGQVIGLCVASGVLAVIFVGVQIWRGDKAALPPRVMKLRNVAFACLYAGLIDASYYTADVWLPIWFQAVKNASAQESGVRSLPLVAGQVVTALLSGYLVSLIGWYNPFMLAATILGSIGLGLTTRLRVDSGPSEWVTFPLLAGLGVGLGTQQPMIGVQASLGLEDIPTGAAAVTLFQNLGPAIIMSVANTVFGNGLSSGLAGIEGIEDYDIAHLGATSLRDTVPVEKLGEVLVAYNSALMSTFYVPMIVAVLSIIGVAGMRWEMLPPS